MPANTSTAGKRRGIPIDLVSKEGFLYVVSLNVPSQFFREPFFVDSLKNLKVLDIKTIVSEDSIQLVRPLRLRAADNRILLTPVSEFIERHVDLESRLGFGFIFHMSRCGSTLVTQMLSGSKRFFVLSEPSIINAVLDPALDVSPDLRRLILQATIKSLASHAPKEADYFFIKFRSWNTLYISDILNAFPNVSWLYVHRNGLEVMRSILTNPPGWLRGRRSYAKFFATLLSTDISTLNSMSDEEYTACLLSAFCRAAKKAMSRKGAYLDYKDIKASFESVLKSVWSIRLTGDEAKAVQAATNLYSKDIHRVKPFEADSTRKQREATPLQRKLAAEYIERERLTLVK